MELICMLHAKGYRRLINLIPTECELPVNEGTRRAIAVFGLSDFEALNVAVPCLAAPSSDPDAPPIASITHVAGERVDGGAIEAFAETVLRGAS